MVQGGIKLCFLETNFINIKDISHKLTMQREPTTFQNWVALGWAAIIQLERDWNCKCGRKHTLIRNLLHKILIKCINFQSQFINVHKCYALNYFYEHHSNIKVMQ